MEKRTPSLICMISDTHGFGHKNLVIPPCDILIHSGDLTNKGEVDQVVELFEWFRSLKQCKQIVFCAGNHDRSLDLNLNYVVNDSIGNLLRKQKHFDVQEVLKTLPQNIHYLNSGSITINDLKIWGSPATPEFGTGWAFNFNKPEIIKEWSKIPSDIDILITHGPAYGIMDILPKTIDHLGCPELLGVIKKRLFNLKLHVFGHIHSNTGITLSYVSNTRKLYFANAAVLDNDYEQAVIHPLTITI